MNVPFIITHPKEYTVPRYVDLSLSNKDIEVINELDANLHKDIIEKIKPDFIFVAGWSGILSGTNFNS